ncbi:MAG: pyridoxamine 5'-phosphate oxidase family protein [Oligoflexus sp.]|nr:pyridoxamine 5'-phosphate oxidase family protein [Pseudopedobacter sp.]
MHQELNQIFQNCLNHLKEAKSSKTNFHFPVIGSINNNEVELRTVVLRDFNEKNNTLVFYTDSRSPKINQIKNNPTVSFLFYDGVLKEQLRIKSKSTIHHNDDISLKHWEKIKPENRRDYASKNSPSSASNDISNYLEKNWIDNTGNYYQNFTVVYNEIVEIDWLVLNKDKNKRARFFIQESGFKGEWLVP